MCKRAAHLFFFFALLSLSWQADARIIEQGTISVEASAFNLTRSFEQGTDSNEYRLTVFGSYFVEDNFEVGSSFSYGRYKIDPLRSTTSSLSLTALYHFPVDENANLYMGTGMFITKKDTDFSTGNKSSDESAGYILRAGWEFFLTPDIAIDIGLSYSRVTWDLTGQAVSSDEETRFYWPQIGFRLFF